uniref:Putative ovule protein n=1 Tax=Solanum chacoense TaxID=4108 RepID=A0A0V0IK51_SOLCH
MSYFPFLSSNEFLLSSLLYTVFVFPGLLRSFMVVITFFRFLQCLLLLLNYFVLLKSQSSNIKFLKSYIG